MQNNIVERLFSSFNELEEAISSAKVTLAKRTVVPKEILERIDSYDSILLKQRNLAETLNVQIHQGNWNEVGRLVNLINGLSAMIRDDARAILSSLSVNSDTAEEPEINFC